jgi:predicted nucleic acid-binding protein
MLVLDASVTLAWILPDEASDAAASVLSLIVAQGAVVPPIWTLEVGNALIMAERRNRLTPDEAAKGLSLLRELPIRISPPTLESDFGQVIALARRHGLTTYDASYLAAAVRTSLPLATLDQRLRTAAGTMSIALVGL